MKSSPDENQRLFEIPAAVRNAPHVIAQTFIVIREAIHRVLFEESLAMQAAAIAFYGILSFAPLVIVLLAVAGWILSASDQTLYGIQDYLSVAFPGARQELMEQLTSFLSQSRVFGAVGIIGLFWSGSRVFASIDHALNEIWRVRRTRPYWKSRLLAIGLVPTLLIVFFASMLATAFYTLVVGVELPLIKHTVKDLPFLGDVVSYAVPLALSVLLFFLLFWLLPARKIPRRSALIGATVSAVLWEFTKVGFDVYIRNFGRMDKVYGTAAGIAILLFWFYYSAMIFLIGAVVGASDMDRRHALEVQKRKQAYPKPGPRRKKKSGK